MKTSLTEEGDTQAGDGHIFYKVQESKAYFQRAQEQGGHPIGRGQFNLTLDITALQGEVYVPVSLASGKKPTGFVYQIEGTAPGAISTAGISCRGEGIAEVTLGTLLYAKIPIGKTATFRIFVEIKGAPGKEYRVVINRINYKLGPNDARYKKFDTALSTKVLKFR